MLLIVKPPLIEAAVFSAQHYLEFINSNNGTLATSLGI